MSIQGNISRPVIPEHTPQTCHTTEHIPYLAFQRTHSKPVIPQNTSEINLSYDRSHLRPVIPQNTHNLSYHRTQPKSVMPGNSSSKPQPVNSYRGCKVALMCPPPPLIHLEFLLRKAESLKPNSRQCCPFPPRYQHWYLHCAFIRCCERGSSMNATEEYTGLS